MMHGQSEGATCRVQKTPSRALSDVVAEQLLSRIRSDAWRAGDKLPTESVLAGRFGVSRKVVREAIARLRHDGALEARHGSGAILTAQAGIRALRIDVSARDDRRAVLHIVHVRRTLGAEVAAQVAQHRSAARMERIDAALLATNAAEASGGDGVLADMAVHREIAAACGTPFFLDILAFLAQYPGNGMHVTRSNEGAPRGFRPRGAR